MGDFQIFMQPQFQNEVLTVYCKVLMQSLCYEHVFIHIEEEQQTFHT